MKRFFRWTILLLGGLLVFVILAGVAGYIWQQGSLPQTEGAIALDGLQGEVEVLRDANGIPTIRAGNEQDALFALGFVHAQDRLFQMEMTRRLGSGRLSEAVGERTIEIDRLMRTFGFAQLAAATFDKLSEDAKAALMAYAAGVNAYLTTHEGAWPIEFYVLGIEPEPWNPPDSLVWGKLMALQLSGNYSDEILRARLAAMLTEAELRQLFPAYPENAPVGAKDYAALAPLLKDLAATLPWEIGPKDASNAWALSPARSTTGGALLANDPHLGLQAPGQWYLARIEVPGWTWVGATAPGVPYMVMGHNGQIAWGFTTTHSDTQDLFIEKIDPENPAQYLTKEGPRAFKTREETITVKDGSAVTFAVRESYHGVVISDAVADAESLLKEGEVLALAWPALMGDDRTPEAIYRLNHAGDVASAIAALRDMGAPQQTLVLADQDGHIALVAPGRVPIRLSGDGTLPVPGWSGDYDWTGFIPYEQLPSLRDPKSGQVITANNKLADDDYPYLIAKDWLFPSRAERITERLAEKSQFTLEDMSAIQNDNLSLAARRLLPRLLAKPLAGPEEALRQLLQDWDGVHDRNRPEALAFNAWVSALGRRVMEDQIGALLDEFWFGNEQRLQSMLGPDSLWCDDRATKDQVEDCDAMIALAAADGWSFLTERFGKDPTTWRWGDAHIARFDHPIFGYVPFLQSWTAYSVETNGGQDTVNRGGAIYDFRREDTFRHVHGPGYRGVYDLFDLNKSRFIIATGQSGNLFSPFYGSLAETWRDGGSLLLGSPADGDGDLLVLKPR